jgi:hypothetical protein
MRTANGMVRTTNDDGQLGIHVFGHRDISMYEATFTNRGNGFDAICDAALQTALDLIG